MRLPNLVITKNSGSSYTRKIIKVLFESRILIRARLPCARAFGARNYVVRAGAPLSTWCFTQRNLWLCLFCESF
jgi:hypothetical protein